MGRTRIRRSHDVKKIPFFPPRLVDAATPPRVFVWQRCGRVIGARRIPIQYMILKKRVSEKNGADTDPT